MASSSSKNPLDTRSQENAQPPLWTRDPDGGPECKCVMLPYINPDGTASQDLKFRSNRCDGFLRRNGCARGNDCTFCHEHPKSSDGKQDIVRPSKAPKFVREQRKETW